MNCKFKDELLKMGFKNPLDKPVKFIFDEKI